MGARGATDPVTAEYAALCAEALAEAERLHEAWTRSGDSGALLAARLVGLLRDELDRAQRGELPPPEHGFPLTRFVGDYEWRPEGTTVVERVYAMQRYWQQHT